MSEETPPEQNDGARPETEGRPTVKPCCAVLRKRPIWIAVAIVVVGLGVVAAAHGVRMWIQASYDPTPAPRPDVDAPFITTPEDIVEKMLQLAEVKGDDLVYDLGCGDGRIVVMAAEKYGCKAWGFDNDPERVEEARQRAKGHGVEHLVTVEPKDFFKLDLSPADVVTLYLLPRLNVKLIPQLEKLKPGSRIVSHDWDMKGVKPTKQIEVFSLEDNREHGIYLWVAPLEKEAPIDPAMPP